MNDNSFEELLNYAKKHNTLKIIRHGFENSEFMQDIPDAGTIVKTILKSLNESKNNYNIPFKSTSGTIISKTTVNEKDNEINEKSTKRKKGSSFCAEFNTICNNILGIIGFELAYNTIIQINIKKLLYNCISSIKQSQTYNEVLEIIKIIRNIYKNSIEIDSSFQYDITKKLFIQTTTTYNDCLFFNIEEDTYNLYSFFEDIEKDIRNNIVKRNNTNFRKKINLYHEICTELYNASIFNTITISSVDNLLISFTNKIGYEGWFIKLWSVLYEETVIDYNLDKENTSDKYTLMNNIIMNHITDDIGIGNYYMKYNSQLTNYFEQVINKSIESCLSKDSIKITFTNDIIKYLVNMTLNLYIQLAKGIHFAQQYNIHFTKNSRVHFALVYNCLITYCKPRLYEYTNSMYSALHYLLLSKKQIEESIKTIENEREMTGELSKINI